MDKKFLMIVMDGLGYYRDHILRQKAMIRRALPTQTMRAKPRKQYYLSSQERQLINAAAKRIWENLRNVAPQGSDNPAQAANDAASFAAMIPDSQPAQLQ